MVVSDAGAIRWTGISAPALPADYLEKYIR